MTTLTKTHTFSAGLVIVSAGLVAGSAISATTMERMRDKLSAPLPSDPVERYQLGQNAFDNPGPKFDLAYSKAPRGDIEINYEYGSYRDGKRMLVPGEPARKKDRMALIAQANYESDYASAPEFAELGEYEDMADEGYFLSGEVQVASNTREKKAAPVYKEQPRAERESAGLKTVAVQYNDMKPVDDSPVKPVVQAQKLKVQALNITAN